MYYILNETNQIIAADDNVLKLCGVAHIDELSRNLALGDTKFDLSETGITITTAQNDTVFPISKISLSSMLGHITLVEIEVGEEKTEEEDLSILTLEDTIEEPEAPLDLESDLISIKSEPEEIPEETALSLDENELFDLGLEEGTEEIAVEKEEPLEIISEDTDILDLGLSTEEDIVLPEAPVSEEQPEIFLDVESISQQIGVSHEDYGTFLQEYIDTALGLEEDLQSTDTQKRSNALGTLSHLSDVLQLPVIGEMLTKMRTSPEDKRREAVEAFYATLSRITTSLPSQEESKMDLFEIEEEKEAEPAAAASEKGFGTISLEDLKPLHFDFQLEEAANDLSLPVELIEEFVHDFIEQCHIETKNMLKAYEEGDLDKIQKIGHLLKGAASNLRINPLADTLYKIQFCEDSNDLEHLIKDYWRHFLSFEIQINALEK